MKEKKQISSKKLILMISTILLSIVAVVGLAIVFVLNYNGFSPDKPQVLDDGKNIYIMTTVNDSYEGYRFKFISGETEIIIDSSVNLLSTKQIMDKGAVLGQTYQVSTCYLGKNKGNNSEFSDEISWQCSIYLDSPLVHYNEGKDSLEWGEVENADFYRVYYTLDDENYIETEELSFDLQTIKGGDYNFIVLAYSNKPGYKTSGNSNEITREVIHVLEGFSEIEFDLENNKIEAISKEIYDKVYIILGTTYYEVNSFEMERKSEHEIKYTLSISDIYNGETMIGIIPASLDRYNVNNNKPIYFIIEG